MQNITIAGDLGSGKSTVAKILCEKLQFKYYSTGNIQRQLAADMGIDTLQLNYISETDASIDKLIDDKTVELNNSAENFILDSRLAWHFIKNSFKIYLQVDVLVAAKRVMADKLRTNEPTAETVEAIAANLLERRAAENKRFLEKYNVACNNINNYDCIVDTTNLNIEQVVEQILEEYNLKQII